MEEEIRFPKKHASRNLFTGYAIGLVVIFSVGFIGIPILLHWITQQIPLVQILLAESLGITFLFGFLPPSLFIIRTGKQIILENAYPHSGMHVLFPTKILHGKIAQRKGQGMLWLGRAAISALILGSCAIHFICYTFITNPMFFVRR